MKKQNSKTHRIKVYERGKFLKTFCLPNIEHKKRKA